mmetsp:Transcript_28450/g.48093  ORF Transcript_28450/g.48093 Transcript_28450/m.48093 type:complete len:442 (-) Transcript_28450:2546-3871(-)
MPLSEVRLFNTIGGTVPSCLWSLRYLSVLHLTGNGLTGKLVSSLPSWTQIADVSLSHNQLSGTISSDILNIASLDLSYNLLAGEFVDRSQYMPHADSNITLEVNRLSGQLPVDDLQSISNGSVNILRGNLFSCNTVPSRDEYSRDYVCGSQNLNVALYVFVSAFVVVALMMALVYWGQICRMKDGDQHWIVSILRSKVAMLFEYMSFMKSLDTGRLVNAQVPVVYQIALLSETLMEVMSCAMHLLIVVLAASLVVYVVKVLDSDDAYATHSNSYAWFWTLAYTRGEMIAGLLVVMWTVSISGCFYCLVVHASKGHNGRTRPQGGADACATKSSNDSTSFRDFFVFPIFAAFLLNACITITVNAVYIYFTQQAFSASVHFAFQLSLSIFRLLYSGMVFPFLSRPIRSAVGRVRFRFLLLTINNLVIPCLVTALTSDSCFQVI